MTVSTTNAVSGPYAANGVTVAFPFTFKAMGSAEIRVTIHDDGAEIEQSANLYDVALNDGGQGGTVTFEEPPASGEVYVYSSPLYTQNVRILSGQQFSPQVIGDALDRAAVRDQDLLRRILAILDHLDAGVLGDLRSDLISLATGLGAALTSFDQGILYPEGTVGDALAHRRPQLKGALTYYVRTDGSDSNNGLTNSAGGAFLTGQAAAYAALAIDTGGHDVTIHFGAGTFEGFTVEGPMAGNGFLNITGEGPTSTTLDGGTGEAAHMSRVKFRIGNLKTKSGGVYGGIVLYNSAYGEPMDGLRTGPSVDGMGTPVGSKIFVHDGTCYWADLNVDIEDEGDAEAYIWVGEGGHSAHEGGSLTLIGTPYYSNAFVVGAIASTIKFNSGTKAIAGSATGNRYYLQGLAALTTLGGDPNTYLPGNANGLRETGGTTVDDGITGLTIAKIAQAIIIGTNEHHISGDDAANRLTVALANAGVISAYAALQYISGKDGVYLDATSKRSGLAANGNAVLTVLDTDIGAQGLGVTLEGAASSTKYADQAAAAAVGINKAFCDSAGRVFVKLS